jgi:CHASE3 domain sensor protein
MKSPTLRWTSFALFIAVLAAAAYLLWTGASVSGSASTAGRAFDARVGSLSRAVMDLRMAQQAYVAAGQGDEFWGSKVESQIESLRNGLTALRAQASSPQAQSHVDEAVSALGDFERLDARAREYARGNQRLLASDLIFSDGLEKTEAMLEAVDAARTIEAQAHHDLVRTARQREALIAGVTAGVAVLFVLLLVPAASSTPTKAETAAPARPASHDTLILRDIAPEPAEPSSDETAPVKQDADNATDPDVLDLGQIAALCGELARLVDTRALPAVLERTASVLDANGMVLWIADPDGRELNPIVTHGYPAQLGTRLGAIPRDAQNATAAAFRTELLQTVMADSISNGAIAVPLVTPGGCVGVMAAEVRNGGEQQGEKLAAAAIVAAQLATLVGPPSSRPQSRSEAAGA